MSEKIPLITPFVPPLPLAEVVQKTLLLSQKQGKITNVPHCSPFFEEKQIVNKKEEENEYVKHVYINNRKKAGTRGTNGTDTVQVTIPGENSLTPMINEFPYLQDPNAMACISDLLDFYCLEHNRHGLSDLMRRYRDLRMDFWDTIGRITYGLPIKDQPEWAYCPIHLHKQATGKRSDPECTQCTTRHCKRNLRNRGAF